MSLASEMFESALLCARKSRNQRAEGLILTSLGDLYGEVEEFDVALKCLSTGRDHRQRAPGIFDCQLSGHCTWGSGARTG